jgi:hypothetical protein
MGRTFVFSTASRTGAFSPGVKCPGYDTDYSPPFNGEVKTGGTIYPLPYIHSWNTVYLIKHRDNFSFFIISHNSQKYNKGLLTL